jgi:CRP-like cAMP-binding protein
MKPMEIDSVASNARTANFRTTLFDRAASEPRLSERPTKVTGGYSPFDIFQWLSPEAQTAFTQVSRRRHFADSGRIYAQSEPSNEMYRILSGCVRMSVLRDDGREALHSVLGAGDCFGICSLLDEAPRHHTTSANGDVELQVLRRESCEFLRAQHASFADGLIRHMSRQTRLLSEYFVSSTLDELPCRVAMRLLKAQKSNLIRGGKIGLIVPLSQSEIALMVGASRQAVNRVLKKFQDDGLINIEYGSVQVLDVEGLQSAT